MQGGTKSGCLLNVVQAFQQAASLSLITGKTTEEEETMQKLRNALIEAYISIVHSSDTTTSQEFEDLTYQAFCYIEQLTQKPDIQFSNEILVQIVELFTDIVLIMCQKYERDQRSYQSQVMY